MMSEKNITVCWAIMGISYPSECESVPCQFDNLRAIIALKPVTLKNHRITFASH